jgi:magnesium chelatase subunit I
MREIQSIQTLGQLKESGYQPLGIKDELRQNLIKKITTGTPVFPGIFGFDDTVIPDIERALLSRHSILLLGLRGQAKTRLARMLVNLLDTYVPIVAGSELNDDPLNPISNYARAVLAEQGDDTPITWLHRNERYLEKLATPDVSIADLVGDVDPIKAANLKLPYSDERVIHFGMIPRANRCLFVINELPDLQARIQVALFNVLQEGDMQIRGFKLRLPLDIQFVFTANPEDYTNRGSIITPLKDRIQSQITTHYPTNIEDASRITGQEARIHPDQKQTIHLPQALVLLIEEIAFSARESDLVDKKSGVSARLTITALENLYSGAERRMLKNKEAKTTARLSDFWGLIPAITGKVEMVYEGEQEGAHAVAMNIISSAIKRLFLNTFPNPAKLRKGTDKDPYSTLKNWFSAANSVSLLADMPDKKFEKTLMEVPGLRKFAQEHGITDADLLFGMELVLHGLAETEIISRELVDNKWQFKDFITGNLQDDDMDNLFN